jgi:hypothetical protein
VDPRNPNQAVMDQDLKEVSPDQTAAAPRVQRAPSPAAEKAAMGREVVVDRKDLAVERAAMDPEAAKGAMVAAERAPDFK